MNKDEYILPEYITIHNIIELKHNLLNHINQIKNNSRRLVLDASKLGDFDAAGLQLLISVTKTCERENIDLKIQGTKEFFNTVLRISGCEDILKG